MSEATSSSAPTRRDAAPAENERLRLPEFGRPYDWPAIDETIREIGGAILKAWLTPERLGEINDEIDAHLAGHPEVGAAATGHRLYDAFLGQRTIRMHGLAEKTPKAGALIGDPEIVDWVERSMKDIATSALLNAGELIQIGPGEGHQPLHRDSGTWPIQHLVNTPLIMNAIFPFDAFTVENGATRVVPHSWAWDFERTPREDEIVRAVMDAGDVLLFRGDILHGGGANTTRNPRRAVSNSYCAGWLRPVENSYLNVTLETVRRAPKPLQNMLGYKSHVGITGSGPCGLYENSDPARLFETP